MAHYWIKTISVQVPRGKDEKNFGEGVKQYANMLVESESNKQAILIEIVINHTHYSTLYVYELFSYHSEVYINIISLTLS